MTDAQPTTVGQRLDRLFSTIPGPDGRLYSNDAAAKALAALGVQVTGQHLWQLRTGKRDNPSFRLLEGICQLFGVPLDYFSSSETANRVDGELAALAALRNAGVKGLLARTAGMSPTSIQSLEVIAAQIRRLEGLDTDTGGSSDVGEESSPNG